MQKPKHPEIEALRRRWREILKSTREQGNKPSRADIEAANMSADSIVAELVSETEKVLKENSERLLSCLKINPEEFQPALKKKPISGTARRIMSRR